MPVNRQTVRELSRTTLYNITSSGQAWRAFLDAAARLYKYSFPEQVLIYAQEPEATACAAKEVWYTRMKRSLRPDAQAIALPDPHSHFGRLKYVFDVRETQPLPGAPEFRQWSLPFEALERVTDRLGQEYGISREPVVADRVYALVMNAPQELYPMQLTAMLRAADAEGRWSGQDDAALARQFHQLVADSAAYMAGVRVGVGAGAVTADALESITRFNSPGLAALAGTYASRLAASVLRDIERAARENGRLAIPARSVQNEGREEFSHAAEAAKEVKDNDIHDTERRALSGPDAGRTGGSTGQIRPAAPPIPGEKRPRPVEQPAAGGRAEQPSGADRPSGARAGGADAGASGTAHKAAGQTDGPAWLGRDDEQPAPAGGGNGDGADLRQLSLFPAEEEIQETGRSGTERPVSLSPDEIDDILRCDREYKKGYKKEDSVTGIDPPELVYFQRANFQAYRDLGYLTYDVMYQYSMWQLMRRKKIPPLRKVRYCCEHLKERPVPQQGRAILSLGVRKYESVGRRKKRDELEIAPDKKRGDSIIMPFDNSEKRRIFETCYQDNQRRINPLAYWTDSDIWSYSRDVGLEQCGLYNEGFERLGCIGCPMARRVGREQEFRRWPKFKAQYLRTFGHMLEDRRVLGLPVLEFASTPEQWFEWWLNDKAAEKADGNQLTLWGYAEGRAAQPARLLDDIAWELGVNISDLRLVPETKRQALDIMRHMRERERYPLHMWEEAVCYLTGAEVQFGDYEKIGLYLKI